MTDLVPRDGVPAAGDPFRRRVTLHRPTSSTVTAELQDHIHHVEVRLEHLDGRVTAIEGCAVRLPWSVCPDAAAQLNELVGAAVGATPAVDDVAAHCTHLFDCATTALRFAGSAAATRRYDLAVTDWDAPVATAVARRDDGFELVFVTDGSTVLGPAPYAGRTLRAGFTKWATAEFGDDRFELATLLRRAIWMRKSADIDLDRFDVLSQSGVQPASCFATQPERIHLATRNRGSSLRALPP